jgi:hypothetical protein
MVKEKLGACSKELAVKTKGKWKTEKGKLKRMTIVILSP